jgi:Family of unknown function (DUF6220)
MPWARNAFTALAAAMLAFVTLQFFTAGLGIFGASDFDFHEAVGFAVLHLLPLLLLIVAAVGKLGRFFVLASLGLLVLVVIQGGLPGAREDAAGIAALHPLVALIIWVLTHMVFQRSRAVTSDSRYSRETVA